jgi:hypothetical protein
MKLPVFHTLGVTFVFSLRNFVAFYLLALLVNLPGFLGTLQAGRNLQTASPLRPDAESELWIFAVEILLMGLAMTVMVRTRMREYDDEGWTVLGGLRDSLERLPTVLVVCALMAMGVTVYAVALEFIALSPTLSGFPLRGGLTGAFVVIALYFCIALPCAAEDDAGVSESFMRSAQLVAGSRLRIIAVYLIAAAPILLAVLGFVAVYGQFHMLSSVPPTWIYLASALADVYFMALAVLMHEALADLGEGYPGGSIAAAFD